MDEFPKALTKPDDAEDCVIAEDAKAEAEANKAGYWFLGKAPKRAAKGE